MASSSMGAPRSASMRAAARAVKRVADLEAPGKRQGIGNARAGIGRQTAVNEKQPSRDGDVFEVERVLDFDQERGLLRARAAGSPRARSDAPRR